MKKLVILIGLIAVTFACNDDGLVELNNDTKTPTVVPAGALFGNAEKNIFDQMVSTNVNSNVFRLFAQQWTETTYLDESRYDILQRNVPDRVFRVFYRDILRDLQEASSITNAEIAVTVSNQKTKSNKLAIIELLNVYSYSVLVDTFGNVPYSQALNPTQFPSPKYDDAQTIYTDLFTRLDAAIANLDSAYGSFGTADFVYQGAVTKWKKFANSLKLKMALTVADVPSFTAIAKTKAEQAVAAGVIGSLADNTSLIYLPTQPNTNPLYEDLVSSGRFDFVTAKPFVDQLNSLNDPRRPFYFTSVSGVYVGCPYAQGGDFADYSSAGDPSDPTGLKTRLLDPTLEAIIMDYTEVEFYLAEAISRGYSVGGTAESHYDNAIASSVIYWGGTAAQATAYLAQPTVAYATAIGSWKQKIGTQAWLGLYNRGFEAWTSYRRLDFPVLTVPVNAATAAEGFVPRRFTYPVQEQTLNASSYASASAAIGGDRLKTKLFWDLF